MKLQITFCQNLTQIDESASGLFGKKAHFLMIGCSAAVLLSNDTLSDTLSISETKSFERMCFGEIFEKSKLPRVQKIAWMNEEKEEIPQRGLEIYFPLEMCGAVLEIVVSVLLSSAMMENQKCFSSLTKSIKIACR